MDYKIIRADKNTGQIEVLYLDNKEPLGTYIIDVPIRDGIFISGTELEMEIQGRAPLWEVARRAALVNSPDFSHIEALVELSEVVTNKAVNNISMWNDVAKEQELAAMLVKFGVLEKNPTSIEVTTL